MTPKSPPPSSAVADAPTCQDCAAFIDTRCPACGCCNHAWKEPVCPCEASRCGCRENREWDEAELADSAHKPEEGTDA